MLTGQVLRVPEFDEDLQTDDADNCNEEPDTCKIKVSSLAIPRSSQYSQNISITQNFFRLFNCIFHRLGNGRLNVRTSKIKLRAAEAQPCALISLHRPWYSPCHRSHAIGMGQH